MPHATASLSVSDAFPAEPHDYPLVSRSINGGVGGNYGRILNYNSVEGISILSMFQPDSNYYHRRDTLHEKLKEIYHLYYKILAHTGCEFFIKWSCNDIRGERLNWAFTENLKEGVYLNFERAVKKIKFSRHISEEPTNCYYLRAVQVRAPISVIYKQIPKTLMESCPICMSIENEEVETFNCNNCNQMIHLNCAREKYRSNPIGNLLYSSRYKCSLCNLEYNEEIKELVKSTGIVEKVHLFYDTNRSLKFNNAIVMGLFSNFYKGDFHNTPQICLALDSLREYLQENTIENFHNGEWLNTQNFSAFINFMKSENNLLRFENMKDFKINERVFSRGTLFSVMRNCNKSDREILDIIEITGTNGKSYEELIRKYFNIYIKEFQTDEQLKELFISAYKSLEDFAKQKYYKNYFDNNFL